MKVYNFLLVTFIPILAFMLIPQLNSSISSNLYSPRIIITPIFVILGSLILFFVRTRGQSIISQIKNIRRLSFIPLVPTLIYITWTCISSLLSPMAGYAWLGFPLLQFGSVMIISSIILSALYSQLVLRNIVIQTLTATTSIMLLLTILESIGLRPLASWIHSGTISYPAATVGHRQHLAGWYAIMSLAPVFIYRNRRLDPWFWVWLLSAFAGVSLCTTSSATLGVVIGLLGWFFVNIRRFKLPLLAIMAFIFMTLTLPLAANTLSSVLNTTSSNFKDYRSTSTIKTRLYMWSAAFSAALQRPFFGWGDETFAFQVFEHLKEKDAASLFLAELSLPSTYKVVHKGFTYYTFDPKGNDKQTGSLIYLRAHGIIFDEMYSRGIIGFIVFCSMILSLILYVHKRDPKSLPLFIASASPYMIYLLAWFYVPTVTPFYLIIIGLMISSIDSPLEEKTQTVVR